MTFNEYLRNEHSKLHPTILDDDLPDAFDNWIGKMEEGELETYAYQFAEDNVNNEIDEDLIQTLINQI